MLLYNIELLEILRKKLMFRDILFQIIFFSSIIIKFNNGGQINEENL